MRSAEPRCRELHCPWRQVHPSKIHALPCTRVSDIEDAISQRRLASGLALAECVWKQFSAGCHPGNSRVRPYMYEVNIIQGV